jgi:hypothetical protein
MYLVGDKDFWKWMGNRVYGPVVEVHLFPIVKEIKGKYIKRNGSVEKPAYYLQSEAGNYVLKLQTELFVDDIEAHDIKDET